MILVGKIDISMRYKHTIGKKMAKKYITHTFLYLPVTRRVTSVPRVGTAPPAFTSLLRKPQAEQLKAMIMTSLKCGISVTAVKLSPIIK